MSQVTVKTGVQRAASRIPFHAGNLEGRGVYVCSPAQNLPNHDSLSRRLRSTHAERHNTYMTTGDRNAPGYAPAYVVLSYGMPIAWVTLDGATHYADELNAPGRGLPAASFRAAWRHQDAIRASWPERFPEYRD